MPAINAEPKTPVSPDRCIADAEHFAWLMTEKRQDRVSYSLFSPSAASFFPSCRQSVSPTTLELSLERILSPLEL